MKSNTVGIAAVAILLVGTGIGPGIALAGGLNSERPVLGFNDMEALAIGKSSSAFLESRPVLSFEEEGLPQVARLPESGMETQGPMDTGSLPFLSDEVPSLVESGGIFYRVGGDTGP